MTHALGADLAHARPLVKTGVRKAEASPGRPIAWPDVLRVLQSDKARSGTLARYRAQGFSAEHFGRLRAAREAMADALTRAEDELELAGGRCHAERLAIRDVRRLLERWP